MSLLARECVNWHARSCSPPGRSAINVSCVSVCTSQARLAELDTPRRLENLQKLEELKRHLMDLEKQVREIKREREIPFIEMKTRIIVEIIYKVTRNDESLTKKRSDNFSFENLAKRI